MLSLNSLRLKKLHCIFLSIRAIFEKKILENSTIPSRTPEEILGGLLKRIVEKIEIHRAFFCSIPEELSLSLGKVVHKSSKRRLKQALLESFSWGVTGGVEIYIDVIP